MKKASILIMIISVLSKILGFAREAIMNAILGPGAVSDAFVFSFGLPTTFFMVVIAAFATGLIPMFTRVENEEGPDKAMGFLNNTLNITIVIGTLVALFMFVFTEPTIKLLLPNADAETMLYLVPFLKVTCFSIIFTAIIQVLTGFLHVRGSFLSVALLGIPLNIIVITTLYLTRVSSNDILPWGILLAYLAQAVLIFGYAIYKGFHYQPILKLNNKHTNQMVLIALPLIVSSATMSIGNLFMQGLASSTVGGLTMINNAQRIGGMVEGIFGLAIITVMFPSLSKAISLGRTDEAKREFGESLVSEMIFILPSMTGLLLLTQPIVQTVFMRGEFDMNDVQILTPVLFTFTLGLVFYSLHNLLVRVFYSYQDMKTPMKISIIIIGLQIVFSFVLSRILGLEGITLGMSFAYAIGVLYEFYLLMRKFKTFPVRKYGKQLIKVLIANLVMSGAIFVCKLILMPRLGNNMFLLITILVAVGVYLMAILVLHVETFDELIDGIKRKVKGV